jgi:hypothetical protein
MISFLRSSICGGLGIQCPYWCVIWTTSDINIFFGDFAGDEFSLALLCSRFFLPQPYSSLIYLLEFAINVTSDPKG